MKNEKNKKAEIMRKLSADIRIETIRALAEAGAGHIGGAMSIADVLAVLYGGVMNFNSANPTWENRDWLVLSKGHAGPGLYASLALKGFFPMDVLKTINKPGTILPSHCDRKKTPGVDMTTGSLGQGMSAAAGIALGNRIKGHNNYTYCIVGDGELQEGQIWEAAAFAAHFKLDCLIVFVDYNKKQLDGNLEDINQPFDIAEKFRSFGWNAATVKGYDVEQIFDAIQVAKGVSEKPSVIVLDTYKGIGCDFAEQAAFNHNMNISWEMANAAIEEIVRRYELGNYPGGGIQ